MRYAMGVEDEIHQFEKRLKNLAQSIQEQQEKRQAFLLTLISGISSLQAIDTIGPAIVGLHVKSGIPLGSFIFLTSLLLVIVGIFLVRFLFPLLYEKFRKKLFKKIYSSKRHKKNTAS